MTKTGYEQTTVSEIRTMLRDDFGVEDEDFLANNKSVLVQKLVELQGTANDEPEDTAGEALDGILDAVQEDSDDDALKPYTEEEVQDIMPAYNSEKWHEYVMLQFDDDELMDGAPTCDGCRRVVESVLGCISESIISNNHPPSVNNNGTATVCVRIGVMITNETHPLVGRMVTCEEIADVNKDNCDHPYHKYPSATAASRAEGRALRKLLRLRNVHTAEEVSERAEDTNSDIDWTVDVPVTDSQLATIEMICKRVNISVVGFINSGLNNYGSVYEVKKSTASRMIKELNNFQRNVKETPTNIGSYDATWRSTQEKESE